MESESSGVFPSQCLRSAVRAGYVRSGDLRVPDSSFQPASIDLRLGAKAYRLRCSFLPDSAAVEEKLADYAMGEIDLRDGAVLERNQPYLIPLAEELALPPDVRAKANPKSSTGRLDVFTRVITDRGYQFDAIAPGYQGRLYLELVSRSFTIRVTTLLSLNQLRLVRGEASCGDDEIRLRHEREPILYAEDGTPEKEVAISRGVFLSVDLAAKPRDRVVGFRARKNSTLLDLTKLRHYDPGQFWEEVRPESKGRVVLDPEEFYLLLSRERVWIPRDLAADMVAYDPTSGELRTHYAGFFDPGFGVRSSGETPGTVAALELRAHDVPFMLEHGQKVSRLAFERLVAEPDVLYGRTLGSSYHDQTSMLSKHFQLRSGQLHLID
jgi:dCTP deaminase